MVFIKEWDGEIDSAAKCEALFRSNPSGFLNDASSASFDDDSSDVDAYDIYAPELISDSDDEIGFMSSTDVMMD